MYKAGEIIAVNGAIYEYMQKLGNLHTISEIEIDEDGMLTATYRYHLVTDEDLTHNEVNFTEDQWYGIVAHFVREGNFDLNAEEMEEATEDIVGRCFAYGIPKIHELPKYIAEYMNR
jgi:hypothetical protein